MMPAAFTPKYTAMSLGLSTLRSVAREPTVARSLIADLAGRVVNLTSVVQTLALDVPGHLARYLFQ